MMGEIKLDVEVFVPMINDLLVELDEHIYIVDDPESKYYGHKRIHKSALIPPCLSCTPLKHGEYDWYTYDHATGWFTSKTNRLE